jgi:hypothetical protein
MVTQAPDADFESRRYLAAALAEFGTEREPGRRERYRRLLASAIESAQQTLAAAGDGDSPPARDADAREALHHDSARRARVTLAQAHAAKAEDARYGAGQLSLSAQRAPTREACDDGWCRVAAIVAEAVTSGTVAATLAAEVARQAPGSSSARAALAAARRAEAAAVGARRIVAGRNHAYTFHTQRGFSFGEGWYVAAAAVLAGIDVQIEPTEEGTKQAETFLVAAGLGAQLRPYRSRPPAMKHTTALVARAFAADPLSAQEQLRAAFLGAAFVRSSVREWIERRLRETRGVATQGKKVLLWIRDGVHHANRNTNYPELVELAARVVQAGLVPVLIGDALGGKPLPAGAVDMILFWKDPIFRGPDMRRAQLEFFEQLRAEHALVGQLGVTTAGMDGPALLGLPTLYLTDAPNVRMGEWVGRVPGYIEVVRQGGYLEHVSRALGQWTRSA